MAEGSDRRGFLEAAIKGSAVLIGAVTVIPGAGLLLAPVTSKTERRKARVLFANAQDAHSATFVEARLEGEDETAPGVFVKRGSDGAPVVLSSVCSHAGCAVSWRSADNRFTCPCHQGLYDSEGRNIAGPPPRPLTRLVATEKNGDIFVEEPEA